MLIQALSLTHFRNYTNREMVFSSPTTVLIGQNAVGKTNILEAIYLLATGESFRAEKIEEMIRWQEEVAHVEGIINRDPSIAARLTSARRVQDDKLGLESLPSLSSEEISLRVILTRGEVQGRRTSKRSFKVNGVARRKQDMVGNLVVVLFRPEDLDLVSGSPSLRRRYLDQVLMQVDREYRRSLVSYEKGLRRRNRLLMLIREGEVPRTTLTFWDQLLVKEGEVLTRKRCELIEFINVQEPIEERRWLEYDASPISENRLKQYAVEEVAAGYTLVGPHRDDFVISTVNHELLTGNGRGRDLAKYDSRGESFGDAQDSPRNLAKYGSRGEQRMGVLWLKVCELQFIESKLGERPVLLLDDVFSELDEAHDRLVMGLLGKQQTIITTTEVDGRFQDMDGMQIIQLP